MTSTLSKPLSFNILDNISKPPSRRPSLVSPSKFNHLSRQHGFYSPTLTGQYQRKKRMAIKTSDQPNPPPSNSSPPVVPLERQNWIIEFILRLVLPFLKIKRESLFFKKEVDKIVEATGKVVEAAEKMVEEVDKAAEEVTEDLSEGNIGGTVSVIENVAATEVVTTTEATEEVVKVADKAAEEVNMLTEEVVKELPEGSIKTTVSFIGNVADQAAKDAQFLDATIRTVEEFEEEVEEYFEPTPSNGKDRKTSKEAMPNHEQASKNNHNPFDIFGSLFPNHFDILDCFLHHFTSFFR